MNMMHEFNITVGVDPGHPSYEGDTGAMSVCGRIVECDYTIHIGRQFKAALDSEPGVFPHMLRSRNDDVIPVSGRAKAAESACVDIVVCIHVDSAPDTSRHGASVFYWPGNDIGSAVASQIAHAWPATLRRTTRAYAAEGQDWGRVRNVLGAYSQTAVLVECGFASNAHDVDALVESCVQIQIVGALVQGIRLFRQRAVAPWL